MGTRVANEFTAPTASVPKPSNAHLFGPVADSLLIGGASIIAFAFCWLVFPSDKENDSTAWAMHYLSYAINFPHFLSSYLLLYVDYGPMIFKKLRYFWAAIIAPFLIIAAVIYGISSANTSLLAVMVQGMYLSVGWHYVKQIYGTVLVTSAVQKRYFGKWEKILMLLNLYAIWGMSWFDGNSIPSSKEDLGITYYSLDFPRELFTASCVFTAISLAVLIVMGVRKYVKTGIRPATASIISFASIYVWYLPSFYNKVFLYTVPFFHSLQYLLFVTTLKRNQVQSEVATLTDAPTKRWTYLKKYWGFFLLAAVLGALAFRGIPYYFDKAFPSHDPLLGTTLWLFSFNIFLNLHHYFIDNVIWRHDSELLKVHVVQASQKRTAENPSAT